ncbi:hypothetical protein [Weissella cibaria]|uniref:hypothetical protein n=1 Tax=Weissella cibaria TaxID=137591 RepID=UPI001E484503|nr:hypothetical protein [Weissella cibaria]
MDSTIFTLNRIWQNLYHAVSIVDKDHWRIPSTDRMSDPAISSSSPAGTTAGFVTGMFAHIQLL